MNRSVVWGSGARILVVALASFTALYALVGGARLLAGRSGSALAPLRLLEPTPFSSFLVPGLSLGVLVGGSSLLCAILAWRRSMAAIDAAIAAGGAATVWIVAELALTRALHPVHALFGVVGVVLLAHGVGAALTSGLARHRWMVTVTAAAWLGFLAPLSVGIAAMHSDLSDFAKVEILTFAGLVEGFVLGFGQAFAFPLQVHRLRYATYSSLAAGLVWLLASGTLVLGQSDRVPLGVVAAAVLTSGIVALTAIGAAQWIELRHFTTAAPEWIGWTALAWIVALPLSVAPGAFVDASTPLVAGAALWAAAGLLMAHVVALVTWFGVKRLTAKHAGLYEEHPSVRRPSASIMPTA